jgi:hypothetical protein
MNKFLATLLLSASALTLRAENNWVATLETESLRSLQLSVSAFAQASSLPGQIEEQNSLLQDFFSLPSLEGINDNETLRVFWVTDQDRPIGVDSKPLQISVLPLQRDTQALNLYLFKMYKSKRAFQGGATYSFPISTNMPGCVLVHETERTMTMAPTRELLTWFQSQKANHKAWLPTKTAEVLRFTFNPSLIDQFVFPDMNVKQARGLLSDSCCYAGLGLNLDGRGCTLTLRLQAKPGTPLAQLMSDLPEPQPNLWNGIPENALLSTLYTEPGKTNWGRYFSSVATNEFTSIFAELQPYLGRERLIYLAPTKSQTGLRLVQIAPVRDEKGARAAVRKLGARENPAGFKLKHEQTRTAAGQTFEQFSLSYHAMAGAPAVTNNSTNAVPVSLATVIPLFIRKARLEVSIKDNLLFAVVANTDTLAQETPDYPFLPPRMTLKQRLTSYSTSSKFVAAGDLRLLSFLRKLLTTLAPAEVQEHKIFATVTDGFQFWIAQEAENTSAISLRLSGNEIAELLKAMKDDRETLQDIFFNLFTNQMKPVSEDANQKP